MIRYEDDYIIVDGNNGVYDITVKANCVDNKKNNQIFRIANGIVSPVFKTFVMEKENG